MIMLFVWVHILGWGANMGKRKVGTCAHLSYRLGAAIK